MRALLEAVIKALISGSVNLAVKAATKSNSERKLGQVREEVAELTRRVEQEQSEIHSKLHQIAKKDLLTSLSYYDEGLAFVYEIFENIQITENSKDIMTLESRIEKEKGNVDEGFQVLTACLREIFLKMSEQDLDGTIVRCLQNAKKRFKDARKKATKAFNNEVLISSERIMAMRYRVLATILEHIDNPMDAVPACKACLEELHSLPCVKNRFTNFKDDVHHLNRIICEITQAFGRRGALLSWPSVVVEDKKIDPRMVYCGLTTWVLGRGDAEPLRLAWSIASNSLGEFIVADSEDHNVKVFDSRGKFLHCLPQFVDDSRSECKDEVYEIWNVATDKDDNIYVLAYKKIGSDSDICEVSIVHVYSLSNDLHHSFFLLEGFRGRSLTVDDTNRVFVTGGEFTKFHKNNLVQIYQNDGKFVEYFGEGIIHHAVDISAADNGQIMILDRDAGVLVFSAQREPLVQFAIGESGFGAIAFHPVSENIFVATLSETAPKVLVFSKDGKRERVINFAKQGIPILTGMTVTAQGRIAVTARDMVLFV